jgi:hypothetical protein
MKWAYAALLGLIVISGCAKQPGIDTNAETIARRIAWAVDIQSGKIPTRPLTNPEKILLEDTVKSKLKDADSAKFKWLPFISMPLPVYCGLVNAKNSFGGYTGYVPYLAATLQAKDKKIHSAVVIAIGNADPDSPETMAVTQKCLEYGYVF